MQHIGKKIKDYKQRKNKWHLNILLKNRVELLWSLE